MIFFGIKDSFEPKIDCCHASFQTWIDQQNCLIFVLKEKYLVLRAAKKQLCKRLFLGILDLRVTFG